MEALYNKKSNKVIREEKLAAKKSSAQQRKDKRLHEKKPRMLRNK